MNTQTTFSERLDPADFRRFVELNIALERTVDDPGRRSALQTIVVETEALLALPAKELLARLPRVIGEAMSAYGWLWNGFYVVRDGNRNELYTGYAFGPPVCSLIERSGGPLSSGMCFDALSLNQTLAAYETKRWPGYVSCDASSGLATVSGIVSPLRDSGGTAIAVWDLDATETIHPGDVRTMDVLFGTLARCVTIDGSCF
jgi:putative methionine-R-sulfoxide reductase with GAF domain